MRIDRAGWPFITGPLAPAAVLAAAGRPAGRSGPPGRGWPLLGAVGLHGAVLPRPRPTLRRRARRPRRGPLPRRRRGDGRRGAAGRAWPPRATGSRSACSSPSSTCTSTARPYRGEVVESTYRKGSFLAAYRKESAHRNERSELWLRDGDRTVVFRQIVGVLARRIVTRTGVGASWPPASGWA